METVGQRLKRLRLERGLSQRDLSEPGVSYAFISRIEAGARKPSVKALRMLARKLDVSLEYLETGSVRTATDELLVAVLTRIDGGDFNLWVRPDGCVCARWRRIYDGIASDEREILRDSLTETLREVLAYEDEADRIDAEQLRLAQDREALSTRV